MRRLRLRYFALLRLFIDMMMPMIASSMLISDTY